MNLSNRLEMISKLIPKCNVLADIGTDHAYIPVKAVLEYKCNKALACDVRNGPLKAAHKTIVEHKLENIIETRLGSGLEPISMGEADVVVIAGMGGELICRLLEDEFEKVKCIHTLILQPMNSIDILRKWLFNNGIDILDEDLTAEGEKIYSVFSTKYTGKINSYTRENTLIGEKLINKKHPLLKKLLNKKIRQTERAIKGIEKAKEDSKGKIPELNIDLNIYLKIYKELYSEV